MIYRSFHDKKLPLLGVGCMRLPLIPGGGPGMIDEPLVEKMVQRAMEEGANYFDTAYPYHDGQSENVLGRILSQYPRESFFLADKYPGHQITSHYDPAEIFEDQLKKCQVEYFDFYLFHNVFENSIHTYNDPKWGIIDYFVQQKKLGRIRHLGFSTHGSLAVMEEFLDRYGEHLDFCQIQLNYLDWTLQDAKEKVRLLNERKMPIWVMEPVRGGKLANLSSSQMELISSFRKDMSPAAWALRFLQNIPGVTVILSGMSNMEQLNENLETFRSEDPLSENEIQALFQVAESLKNSVPCTACQYCVKGCPKGLDIPTMLSIYNELQVVKSFNASMRLEFLPEEKKPTACISCGLCEKTCPQKIAIPQVLKKLSETLTQIPSWSKVCQERERIAKEAREKENQSK